MLGVPAFFIIVICVAVVLVAMASKGNGAPPDQVECRSCGMVHPRFAQYCRRCGKKL